MKILKIEIFSPDLKLLRQIQFNENGLSIIYGDVEKPTSNSETSNSIGKTVLLKIVNVVLGANNSGKDTIKGLDGYEVKAKVKYNLIEYDVEITIGDSKKYFIDGTKYTLTKYREKFNINRAFYGKQIMLEKRKGLLSNISRKANKDDISTILKLLYLENIELIFKKIKKMQDEIDLMGKYNKNFKDDINKLEREKFTNEMKRKEIDEELTLLNEKLKTLKLSENISEIVKNRTELDQKVKQKNEIFKINELKINKYNQIIDDSKNKSISLEEVEKIYSNAKLEIPELLKKNLKEVEGFYENLLEDKKNIYIKQINELNNDNKKIREELKIDLKKLDELSEVISENDSIKEGIKIYDLKTKEKISIETKISEIIGKLAQINSSKDLKGKIDNSLIELEETFSLYQTEINEYREFIYNLVRKIYGEERNPYLNINVTNTNKKYQAMPVTIDLTFDGDSGEGLTSAKYLLFDMLIMNYTDKVDFLIEDSSCFEAIDRRQIRNIIYEGIKISERKNKQFIITLNKYLIDNPSEIEKYITLRLSEDDTLLNIKF